jgi:hypothetical protein
VGNDGVNFIDLLGCIGWEREWPEKPSHYPGGKNGESSSGKYYPILVSFANDFFHADSDWYVFSRNKSVQVEAAMYDSGGVVWAQSSSLSDNRIVDHNLANVDIFISCSDQGKISVTPTEANPNFTRAGLNAQVKIVSSVSDDTATVTYAAAATYQGNIKTTYGAQIGKKDVGSLVFSLEITEALLQVSDQKQATWKCACDAEWPFGKYSNY